MKPLLLLDVDGVLNPCPYHPDRSRDWEDFELYASSEESGRRALSLSKSMGQALLALECDIQWLTFWVRDADHANPEVGARLGWPTLPVAPFELRLSDYVWKFSAVRRLLQEPGPALVWVDDNADTDLHWVRQSDVLWDRLDPHGRLLAVSPVTNAGLTKAHVEQIKDWLAAREGR